MTTSEAGRADHGLSGVEAGRPGRQREAVQVSASRPRRGWRSLGLVGGVYLILAVGLWWNVWSGHPSAEMTCGCTDAARETWYLEWAAYAVVHAHDPLYSQWVLFPHGLNVLADTSVLLIGFLMTPVTLVFGPVVSMNVVSTLEPALSALSMFWLLRRWVRWQPAAFIGGLCFGFSSFMLVQLAFGWINIAALALLPLMVGCLDDLLVRHSRSPRRTGAVLGLLMAAEFFVSSEVLLLAVLMAAIGMAVLLVRGALLHRRELRSSLAVVLPGFGSAAAVATLLLAGPLLFFAAGPAHLGAVIWSGARSGPLGNSPPNFWSTVTTWGPLTAQDLVNELHRIGGYAGPALPSMAYLGVGLTVVVVLGLVIWHRDRRLWFWGLLGAIAGLLSLRVAGNGWSPWTLVDHFSVLKNVWPSRFSVFVDFSAAVLLGLTLDHVWTAVRGRARLGFHDRTGWWPPLVATLVAVIALGPVAMAEAPNIPMTMQRIAIPTWFVDVAPWLRPGQVLLTYPTATYSSQTPLLWQAVDRLSFRLAGGGGPAATAARAGADRLGFEVLQSASVAIHPPPAITAADLAAARRVIGDWRVSMVVVPDQRQLPDNLRGRSNAFAVGLFTAILGVAPDEQRHAWVWTSVAHDRGPVPISSGSFERCTSGRSSPSAAERCVLAVSASGG